MSIMNIAHCISAGIRLWILDARVLFFYAYTDLNIGNENY